MATTGIRWAAAKRLVTLLRAQTGAKVSVEPGWPGEQAMRDEMMWIDEIRSTVDAPVITGGRIHRDDFFTIPVLVRVAGAKNLDATMERLEQLVAHVENVVADEHTLDDLDGVVSAEVQSADVTCGRTPDAFLGFARCEVQVHARLT